MFLKWHWNFKHTNLNLPHENFRKLASMHLYNYIEQHRSCDSFSRSFGGSRVSDRFCWWLSPPTPRCQTLSLPHHHNFFWQTDSVLLIIIVLNIIGFSLCVQLYSVTNVEANAEDQNVQLYINTSQRISFDVNYITERLLKVFIGTCIIRLFNLHHF